jgi:mono/diheme cytochrome c family protein
MRVAAVLFPVLLLSVICPFARGENALPPAVSHEVEFVRDIQPLFEKHCVKCHGPEKQKGDLRLDVKSMAMRGGEDGAVIVPGEGS